jgi:hypothetical protein
METTAGDTRSKMSAKVAGAPGGGAKIGAVEALISPPCSSALAWVSRPLVPVQPDGGARRGGAGHTHADHGARDETLVGDGHLRP